MKARKFNSSFKCDQLFSDAFGLLRSQGEIKHAKTACGTSHAMFFTQTIFKRRGFTVMSVALDCLWPVDLISGPPSLPLCCTREATQTQGPILVLNKKYSKMLNQWYIYRPQTKFAKVMFFQVFFCPQGRGACVAGGSILRDTVNERTVHILLECILVMIYFIWVT